MWTAMDTTGPHPTHRISRMDVCSTLHQAAQGPRGTLLRHEVQPLAVVSEGRCDGELDGVGLNVTKDVLKAHLGRGQLPAPVVLLD